MKDKYLYYSLIIFGVFILLLISSISLKYKERDDEQCKLAMEGECPHENYYPLEFYLGMSISIAMILLGIYYLRFKKGSVKRSNPSSLKGDEKLVYSLIVDNEGAMFQNELVEKTGFPRAKITRILDKLEGKGLVVRKRRGMTNIIILKE